MLKVTDAVEEILKEEYIAFAALQQDHLNLSAFARSIQPEVERLTKKSVQLGTIVTAISRMQRPVRESGVIVPKVAIDDISVKSGLVELAFEKTQETQRALQVFSRRKIGSAEFFAVTQGQAEISLIAPAKWVASIHTAFKQHPILTLDSLSSLTIRFSSKYITQPNVLFSLLSKFAAQKIVVVELISTFTEVSFIVHDRDIEAAFRVLRS